MNVIRQTEEFVAWLDGLRDPKAWIRILRRIDSAKAGNFGDHKSVGEGVFEMRIDYGPGYRLYYARTDVAIYLLLLGGDKSSQRRDISAAHALWKSIKEGT